MNTPNKLTVLRMILVPFVIFFYLASFVPYGTVIALILFIIASFTDYLDGYIARKNNLVTNFGKFLDPIADKILTTSVLIMLVADGTIPAPYGVIALAIIVAREFVVAGVRQLAASNGVVVAADKWGKWKTVSQMIAIIGYMVLTVVSLPILYIIIHIVFAISVILTIISGTNYLTKNINVLKG